MSIICLRCGETLPETAAKCPSCGVKVESTGVADEPDSEPDLTETIIPRPLPADKIALILVFSAILIIAFAVGAYMVWQVRHKSAVDAARYRFVIASPDDTDSTPNNHPAAVMPAPYTVTVQGETMTRQGGVCTVTGQITNTDGAAITDGEAVTTFDAADGSTVIEQRAALAASPLAPGASCAYQTSTPDNARITAQHTRFDIVGGAPITVTGSN